MDSPHRSAEAFKLMSYESVDGSVFVRIWNSRDGVTPFIVSRQGQELTHVRWESDVYAPLHRPSPGDLVFIDMTMERALPSAEERMRRLEGRGGFEECQKAYSGASREEIIQRWAESYVYHDGADGKRYAGQPCLIEWGEEMIGGGSAAGEAHG